MEGKLYTFGTVWNSPPAHQCDRRPSPTTEPSTGMHLRWPSTDPSICVAHHHRFITFMNWPAGTPQLLAIYNARRAMPPPPKSQTNYSSMFGTHGEAGIHEPPRHPACTITDRTQLWPARGAVRRSWPCNVCRPGSLPPPAPRPRRIGIGSWEEGGGESVRARVHHTHHLPQRSSRRCARNGGEKKKELARPAAPSIG